MGYLPVFWGSGSPCAAPLSALGLPSPAQGCWDLGQLSQTRAKPQGAEMGLFPSTLKLGRRCSLFLLPIPQLSSLSLLCLHPWLPPHSTLLHASTPCIPLAGISVSSLLCCRASLQPLSGGFPMASQMEKARPRSVLVSDRHVLLLPNTNKAAEPAAQLCHTQSRFSKDPQPRQPSLHAYRPAGFWCYCKTLPSRSTT